MVLDTVYTGSTAPDSSTTNLWVDTSTTAYLNLDYNDLTNQPQINGITLTGNKTAANLSLATAADVAAKYDANNPPPYPVSSVNGQTGAVSLSIPSTPADIGAAPAVTEVTVSTAGAVTQALDAGKIYHFTGALSSLTLTFNAAASGQIAQYHFDFDSGSTAPTVTLPNGVTMQGGTFTPEANKHYEVDILNNYGVSLAW